MFSLKDIWLFPGYFVSWMNLAHLNVEWVCQRNDQKPKLDLSPLRPEQNDYMLTCVTVLGKMTWISLFAKRGFILTRVRICLSWFSTFHSVLGEFQTQFSPLFSCLGNDEKWSRHNARSGEMVSYLNWLITYRWTYWKKKQKTKNTLFPCPYRYRL